MALKTIAFVVLPLLGASFCSAQNVTPVAPARGAFSVGFNVDWFHSSSGDETTFTATPAYFVTDNFEVRLPLSVDDLLNNKETVYGLGVRLHFAKKNAAGVLPLLDPFIGAEVEHASAGHGFHEDFVAGQVGAHYFVANNVAVTGLFTVGSDRSNGLTQTTSHLTAGFTIFFSGK